MKPAVGLDPAAFDTLPKPIELTFGTAIHHGLDVYYETRNVEQAQDAFVTSMNDQNASFTDPVRNVDRGVRLLADYDKHWRLFDESWDLLEAEASFTFDIEFPVPGQPLPWTLRYHGKIDKILYDKSRSLYQIRDHKTTKWAGSSKIDAYSLSNQGLGYLNGLSILLGEDAVNKATMLFDILVLNPKNNAFHRSDPIVPQQHLMDQFRLGVSHTATMMVQTFLLAQERKEPHEIFPMHGPDACAAWNRLCPFFRLCDADPDILRPVLDMLFYYNPWDPEER